MAGELGNVSAAGKTIIRNPSEKRQEQDVQPGDVVGGEAPTIEDLTHGFKELIAKDPTAEQLALYTEHPDLQIDTKDSGLAKQHPLTGFGSGLVELPADTIPGKLTSDDKATQDWLNKLYANQAYLTLRAQLLQPETQLDAEQAESLAKIIQEMAGSKETKRLLEK